jgi:2-desacetyl-2-hydroxyethyl bacteriochlorophyllide A dehydrogenase
MTTQLQVTLHGPDDVRLDEVPVPEPGPADVDVRVAACGICGSDVGYVKAGGLFGPTGNPMPLGHELSGVVDRVGADVRAFAVGDRVVVDPLASNNVIGNGGSEGGFTPRLLVRGVATGGGLIPVPPALSLERAALAEPLGVGMRAVDRSRARAGERAVVFGSGPIGLAALACLVDRGVEDVVVVDLADTRLALATRLGARAVLNPARDDVWASLAELHGRAAVYGMPVAESDLYIEASGAGPVVGDVVRNARAGARLVVVGLHKKPVEVDLVTVMMKELDLLGSIGQPEDWTAMLDLLGRRDLGPMVTHAFPLERFADGLAVARDPEAGGKVMIRIDPELA